jgi:MerR family transcriptional regulator, light-induced transcriptional regulator
LTTGLLIKQSEPEGMGNYSIKDLEKLSGIKAHTIRIWEKRYQLIRPERTCTNIRLYSDHDLKRILNISILNRRGLKISHIANLSEEELRDKIVLLSKDSFRQDDQVENLVLAMIDLDEPRFDKILSASILNIGFEETFHKIVYPLLERIGMLWQSGTINPAHEHFLTNLIRQKLIVAIDGIMQPVLPDRKVFILFLPEGEMHELGLLYYYYLIKKKGHKVLYLGSSVPLHDVAEIIRTLEPDILVSFFVSNLDNKQYGEFLNIFGKFPVQKIYLSGMLVRNSNETLPENVAVISSPPEFNQMLQKLN